MYLLVIGSVVQGGGFLTCGASLNFILGKME